MNSVYFPAHVVVLLRRLVNVVSTLSISNQYISRTQSQRGAQDDTSPHAANVSGLRLQQLSSDALRNMERPLLVLRKSWDRARSVVDDLDIAQEIHKAHTLQFTNQPVLKTTLDLPRWTPGNWSWLNLFSLQPQLGEQPSDSEPPPQQPFRKDDSSHNGQSQRDPPPKKTFEPPQPQRPYPPDLIHQLLVNPALYDPLRTPRYPIVLCHGLYGFDSRGPSNFPSMRMHYWSNVLRVLRGKVGAEVIVTSVPGTGSIPSRAARLDEQLRMHTRGRGVNFLAHSMGGLDCRHVISHIRPKEYTPLSLTSIATPHRGSPFMDWCASNIGIGKLRQHEKELKEELRRSSSQVLDLSSSEYDNEDYDAASSASSSSDSRSASTLKSKPKEKASESSFSLSSLPSSFTTLILGIVDSPAYANLTSHYLNEVFNPATPDDPRVKYFSVAGRLSNKSVNIWHPFWLPKMVLDGTEETERERLKKNWEEGNGDRVWKNDVPLWANEREWGNDGLVTVQSAKWGEFLGIMEGCDHWEMRGARGIEFGVDLPAIPAIGLGSSPASTSIGRRSATAAEVSQAQGDGWGFGDWTRFVGAWNKSKDEAAAAAEKDIQLEKKDPNSATPSSTSVSPGSAEPSAIKPPRKDETRHEKRVRDRAADDEMVKSSTDTLSAVFDWLIERVPATSIPNILSASSDSKGKAKVAPTIEADAEKALHAAAATYRVGVGSTSNGPSTDESRNSASPSPSPPPSEMKQRMEREDKGRKRNELASKQDLENFYVALSRKMYDAGL